MPLYEYKCKKCGHVFERIQKFSDPHVKKCPDCGGAVAQVISAPAVQFKGSGWYVTDYAKGAAKPSATGGDSEAKDGVKKEDNKEDKREAKEPKKETEHKKETKPKPESKSEASSKKTEK